MRVSREVIAMNEMAYMLSRFIQLVATIGVVEMTVGAIGRIIPEMGKSLSYWVTPRGFIKRRAEQRKEEESGIPGTPVGEQPQSSPQPKPRPRPQPVGGSLQCSYMNYSWCGGELKVGNVTWDKEKGVEFDVVIPDGCTCCFDVDADVVRDGLTYAQPITIVGPYGPGAHHVKVEKSLPEGTKDIIISPRCKGTPSRQKPSVGTPCTLDVDRISVVFNKDMNAVVASFSGKLISNCYDCDCVVKVYAESQEFWPGAKTLVANCFTDYGHTRTCTGSSTVYGTSKEHGHDIIKFYAVITSSKKGYEKRFELGEVEVIW